VMRHVGEQPDDLRQAFVFPNPNHGRGIFTLVEDDGISLGYQRSEYTEVALEVSSEPDRISLQVHAPRRGYPLLYREVEFILPAGEARPVQVRNGQETLVDAQGRRRIVIPIEAN
jgi:hypothetical protein